VQSNQPFFFVTLTARDIALLGETPSMRDIAACLLHKIMTTQPSGPYIIGGGCAGSVLAYEVASQLIAAGEEVSVLLLFDAPTQPYLKLSRALTTRLKHPRFYLYRAARVGWRKSLANLFRRAIPYSPRSIRPRLLATESNVAHRIIEHAAFDYQAAKYEGKVLLLLAKERDPLFDFLPGWRSVLSNDLSVFYLQGRHRDLITSNNVREIASLIQSSLKESSAVDGNSLRASA
jgi:thioesterase domain-containing protein